MPTPSIWLATGLRTPFARVDGPLAGRDALTLAVPVVQAMGRQATGPVDLGIWGTVAVSLAYSNLAREVWLEAGLDPRTPTFTTILQCCTSMVAAFQAAAFLGRPGLDLALVGGSETASRVQIGLSTDLSVGLRRILQGKSAARKLAALRALRPRDIRLYVPQIKNRATGKSMGEHCEEMAKEWKIGRGEQDEYALESHRRAIAAQDAGFPQDIVPVDGLERDQFPRRDTSLERLGTLKPVFREDGRCTAGNSSQISDGAAALLLTTRRHAETLGIKPRARVVAFTTVGADPELVLTGPIPASHKVLAMAGLRIEDVDLYEINEAFAPVPLAWLADVGGDPDKLNVHGGAIALGHPMGASGARLMNTMLNALEQRRGRYGLQAMCCNGGIATATIIERLG